MRCDYCGWLNSDEAKRCVKCNQELLEVPVPTTPIVVDEIPIKSTSNASFKATVKLQSKDGEFELPSNITKVAPTSCFSCGYPFASEVSVCPACGATVVLEEIVEREEIAPIAKPQNTKATIRDMRSMQAMLDAEGQEEIRSKVNLQNAKATVRDMRSVESILAAVESEASALEKKNVEPIANLKQTVRDFGALGLVSDVTKDKDESVAAKTVAEYIGEKSLTLPKLTAMENLDGGASEIKLNSEGLIIKRENVGVLNSSIDEEAHAQIEFSEGDWYISNLSKMNNTYVLVNRKMKLEKGDVVVVGNKRYIFE